MAMIPNLLGVTAFKTFAILKSKNSRSHLLGSATYTNTQTGQPRFNDRPNSVTGDLFNEHLSQQAHLNFDKTFGGSGRSWEGYERIGVLFITWQTETQHRLTDVSTYKNLSMYEYLIIRIGGRVERSFDK